MTPKDWIEVERALAHTCPILCAMLPRIEYQRELEALAEWIETHSAAIDEARTEGYNEGYQQGLKDEREKE